MGKNVMKFILKDGTNKNEYNEKTKEEIFNLFVAVNVRKYFNSKTLRNFALFIRSYTKFKDNMTFEEILSDVKDFFKNELTKEKMQARLVQNVKIEKKHLASHTRGV